MGIIERVLKVWPMKNSGYWPCAPGTLTSLPGWVHYPSKGEPFLEALPDSTLSQVMDQSNVHTPALSSGDPPHPSSHCLKGQSQAAWAALLSRAAKTSVLLLTSSCSSRGLPCSSSHVFLLLWRSPMNSGTLGTLSK